MMNQDEWIKPLLPNTNTDNELNKLDHENIGRKQLN